MKPNHDIQPLAGNACRTLLWDEFATRRQRHPNYSLRAFSKATGVSHGALSQIFSGRRPLTKKTALKIATRLGWSADKLESFLKALKVGNSQDVSFSLMDMDKFRVISEWHHYAILSLLELPQQEPLTHWISERLGISEKDAVSALARLKRLGIIEKKQGKLRQCMGPLMTTTDIPVSAIRHYHEQNLQKAAISLEQDAVDMRDFSSITMAIDVDLLPKAKEEIRKFRRSLCRLLESRTPKRVYTLAVQLFPVDCETKYLN